MENQPCTISAVLGLCTVQVVFSLVTFAEEKAGGCIFQIVLVLVWALSAHIISCCGNQPFYHQSSAACQLASPEFTVGWTNLEQSNSDCEDKETIIAGLTNHKVKEMQVIKRYLLRSLWFQNTVFFIFCQFTPNQPVTCFRGCFLLSAPA